MSERDEAVAVREAVRARYAAHAANLTTGGGGCCGGQAATDPITGNLYDPTQADGLTDAVAASLGCGNPTALIDLRPGETVLDLGSGAGLDVLLSARRVGPSGFAYGLDMTDEMLALAERHRQEQGATNVRFLKGHIEAIPLPDASVDVVISNCVINLAADKGQVLREAYRVLRPGGRFAVSDVVVLGHLPAAVRASMEAWAGCIAGALDADAYRHLLHSAGFLDIEVEVTREYDRGELLARVGLPPSAADAAGDGRLVAAFVRARKAA